MEKTMTIEKKNIAILALGAVLLSSTGMYAVAQSASPETATIEKADFRGKGNWERHGKRGGKHGNPIRALLKNADLNDDGSLTQEELDTYRAKQVADADADGDGNISLAEFETIWLAQTNQRMVRAFQRLDRDASGSITKAEQDKPFANLVERMDRNGDGKLNKDDRPRHKDGRHHKKPRKG